MKEYILIIKIRDLCYINKAKDPKLFAREFKSGKILGAYEYQNSESILSEIYKKYDEKRLPKSYYFFLSEKEVKTCLSNLESREVKRFRGFFTGSRLVLTFLFFWLAISILIIKFSLDPILNKLS